jgi:hypothetical protein
VTAADQRWGGVACRLKCWIAAYDPDFGKHSESRPRGQKRCPPSAASICTECGVVDCARCTKVSVPIRLDRNSVPTVAAGVVVVEQLRR